MFRWADDVSVLRPGILALVLVSLAAPALRAQPAWDVTKARGETRTVDFVTTEGTWMSVDPSPDGRWIAFDLLGHVYRVPAAGGEAENLTEASGIALSFHPRYSPDGGRIAFVSDRAGQNSLWIMDADGSDPRPVFLDPVTRISEPTWTPDGTALIAVRNFPTYSMHRRSARLWRFPLDGGAPEELVGQPSATQAWAPSVSPDGNAVYYQFSTFAEPLHGVQRRQHIRRYDFASGGISVVTMPESHRWYWADGARELAPRVSPDGRWLAFARRIPGGSVSFRDHVYSERTALWLRDLETGEERLLLDPITSDMADAHGMKNVRVLPGYGWDHDSRSLVVSRSGGIVRVRVEDGSVEPIPFRARVRREVSGMARNDEPPSAAPARSRFLQHPAFAADGRFVVFGALGAVWRADVDGGEPRRLAGGSGPDDLFAFMPALSPDGAWVAYVTWDDARLGHVWKVPTAGGEPVRLTQEPALWTAPVWTADGAAVLAARGRTVHPRALALEGTLARDLVRIPAAGGAGRVVPGAGTNGVTPLPGGRIAFAAAFSPGDIQYPLAEGRPIPDPHVTLVSVSADGSDRREHARLPGGPTDLAPSPDGRWLAFRDDYEVYLAPLRPGEADYEGGLRWQGREGLQRIDRRHPDSGVRRLSHGGGLQPRWRDASTLEFVSADRIYTHHPQTGRTDTARVRLPLPRDVPRGRIALTGARVITMEAGDGRVLEGATIVVEDNRIACVGSCDTAGADRVIDVAGHTIMPGIVDVHAHHLMGAGGVVPQRRWESAIYLAYGVTTVLDPSATPELAFPVAELVDAGRIVGPRTYSVGDALHYLSPGTGPQSYEEAAADVERLASWGAISVKQYLVPRRDQRQWINEAARRHGLSVTAEGADLYYNLSLILDGHTGWEHPLMYLPLYDDAAQFFGQAGAVYSPTLTVAGAGLWAEDYFQPRGRLWENPKQQRFTPWHRLARSINDAVRPLEAYSFPILAEGLADIRRAGGYGSVGGHGEQTGLDSHWEIWLYATGMTPMEALEVATMDGAYMLGMEEEIGSLRAGKLADLVVLRSNPLDDVRNTADIRWVMKGGRLYDGDTLDEAWPRQREFGPIPWADPDVFRTDTLPVEAQRPGGH